MRQLLLASAATALLALGGCADSATQDTVEAPAGTANPVVDAKVEEARAFLAQAEADIESYSATASNAYWNQATNITPETNAAAEAAGTQGALLSTRLANEAKRFNGVALPDDMRRKIDGLKRGSNFPAPDRDGAAEDLSGLMSGLDMTYATGKFQADGEELSLFEATDVIANSRDPEELRAVWEGWRTVSPVMAEDYAAMVEIINEGSRELGYADAGALWRAGYDMDADAFAAEVDRLYDQIRPLYEQLHCYVRAELNEEYGDEVQPETGPIRADLLGNMWSQGWSNIYDVVEPDGMGGEGVDVTALLEAQDYTPVRMVETGDAFFQSMGFDPLPDTFWERSMIVKPDDREVQCHASAWNLDDEEDVRIKMCTKVTGEDFNTVHHELGHNIYQRAYKDQPVFYKTGANDGFHEAIGDMIALSITPDYLVQIDLLDEDDVPGADADLALLMNSALDKVAFMPFSLMVDKWRWQVFDGTIAPEDYNAGWWELRTDYQGVVPPGERPADAFDPGAKYHIPGNTPYMRYFLAHILQYQFHQAACEQAGFDGPLHRCSVYGNEAVGERFNAMMELGASQPWPDALEAFTGTREMDASAMLDYYAPLAEWLEEQNAGRSCGW